MGWSGAARISASVAARVDVPEDRDRAGRAGARQPAISSSSNTPTPLALTTTSAAAASAITPRTASSVGGVDHDAGVVRRLDVAMALPVEGVGLVEGDVVAVPRQLAQHAAIVGRRAVPVRRQQAGAVEGDLHAAVSRTWSFGRAGGDGEQLVARGGRRCGGRGSSRGRARPALRAAPARRRARAGGAVIAPPSPRPGSRTRRNRPRCPPRRADQRDAAGQRLEHADRRDAGQLLGVEAPRHVHGGEMTGEDLRRGGVGEPAAVARAVALAAAPAPLGVAHAVDVERQAGSRAASSRKLSSSRVRSPSPQLPIQTRPSRSLLDRRRLEKR